MLERLQAVVPYVMGLVDQILAAPVYLQATACIFLAVFYCHLGEEVIRKFVLWQNEFLTGDKRYPLGPVKGFLMNTLILGIAGTIVIALGVIHPLWWVGFAAFAVGDWLYHELGGEATGYSPGQYSARLYPFVAAWAVSLTAMEGINPLLIIPSAFPGLGTIWLSWRMALRRAYRHYFEDLDANLGKGWSWHFFHLVQVRLPALPT